MGEPVPVLVVERSSAQPSALLEVLVDGGFAPTLAHTATQAIHLTMDTAFQAAIVEVELSGESGLSVLHHLRADGAAVPVLMISGEADVAAPARAFEAGADDFLTRPVVPTDLVARLKRRMSTARQVRALLLEREELKALSTTDGLTQVANHRAFQERLKEEFRRAQRYDDPLALIVMDIDHFKTINDTWGHQAGDEVLTQVAAALKEAVRETDFVARYGGEEFAVLLPKTHLAGALTVAERMSQALRAARSGVDGSIRVTASFGVSGFPGRGVTTGEQLVRTADEALYRSKGEGRNKISLFQSSLYVASSS
jgi:two-component system, cell cycle response regulator